VEEVMIATATAVTAIVGTVAVVFGGNKLKQRRNGINGSGGGGGGILKDILAEIKGIRKDYIEHQGQMELLSRRVEDIWTHRYQ
jgi:hypothetical protein